MPGEPLFRGSYEKLALSGGLVIGLIASSVHAQGGPPLVTEDPGTPGAGHWEINIAAEHEEERGDRMTAVPVLDLNYGWGERIQLKLELPWLIEDPGSGRSRDGLGLWELGVKWRFMDGGPEGVRLSIYPQLEIEGPGTDEDVAGDDAALALPVQVAKAFGRLEVSAEAGYLLLENDANEWFAGVAAGVAVASGVEVLGEVYGSALGDSEGRFAAFNLGLALELSDGLILLASAGRAIDGQGPDRTAYLGVQVLR